MTEKRFYTIHKGVYDELKRKELHHGEITSMLNALHEENEQLKQYKQAVSDVLLSYGQKNLSAKQLGLLTTIMQELGVLE